MLKGYILLLLAGICQGSFGLGYKRHTPLSWELFWAVYNVLCFAVMALWTFYMQPDLLNILSNVETKAVLIPFLCGIVWGLSTIAFSKSVLMVGMSLCFGTNMGVSAVIGSVIPFFRGQQELSARTVILFSASVIITLAGIAIITKAGMNRDKGEKQKSLRLGILFAIISGICSGMMNIGFDYAAPLGTNAISETAAAAVQWFPVLGGGNIAAILFCIAAAVRNKSLNSFLNRETPIRMIILSGTAVVWFAALALYGIASKLTLGAGISWLVFNALALIVSNFWGIRTGEWSEHKNEKRMLIIGEAVLMASWAVMAII